MSEGMSYKHILNERDRMKSSPKAKALEKVKSQKPKIRMLTLAEQKEKTKNWPKGPIHEPNEQERLDYQRRHGRAYND